MHHSTFANLSLDAVGRWRVHRTPGQVQWWCGTNGRAEGGRVNHRVSTPRLPVSGLTWLPLATTWRCLHLLHLLSSRARPRG